MSQPQMLKPSLELVTSSGRRTYEIAGADFHVGRLANLDLFLDNPHVSRPHARIQRREDGSYEIVDLRSQNGTHLNGKKIVPYEPRRLRDGDHIRIVPFDLYFRHPGPIIQEPKDDHTTVLRSLADLSSERLVTRSSHPAAAFRAVLEVVRSLSGGGDLGEVLSRAVDGLMRVFPQAERGFIVLAKDDGSVPLAAFRNKQADSSVPTLSRTIRARVLRDGQAVLIKDIAIEGDGEGSLQSTIRSAICVPLQSHDGRRIGMVQLDRLAEHDDFQESDLDLLAALGVPIGVAVENDQLLKERASWTAAREIQRALLPQARPAIPGYTFWECYRPAEDVGGDLYDYIPVEGDAEAAGEGRDAPVAEPPGPGRWAVTLGDVAGKGMPAALIMAGISPEVRHLVRAGVPVDDALSRVNRHFYDHGVQGRFVTLLIGTIAPDRHDLTLAVAGHPHALLRRSDGTYEDLAAAGAGPPLGVFPEPVYRAQAFTLERGDVVVFYSDGVVDAMDHANERFGTERLESALIASPPGVAAVGESILAAVRDHFAGRSQFDDITIVCFGRD
ncbi:Phosphoserine phosphatase RsbU [Aquisphaera giovannonii]|uniref:Phosphoserine phosphatase RsbU n=1 Tax=Aquisphaera giovannonii TaxID=406548 RepID=A0A5B9WDX5_9BACT|nr:SpoIIE family protein phosphatase [Aquisphaera giovannonii]QEH38429.1 Phosphoserine phosphatase RsbU [Aquisphaera giovannonii]